MIHLCSFIVMLCFKVFADSRITVFTKKSFRFFFLFFVLSYFLGIIPIGHTNIFIVSRFIYSCLNFYRLDLIMA